MEERFGSVKQIEGLRPCAIRREKTFLLVVQGGEDQAKAVQEWRQ